MQTRSVIAVPLLALVLTACGSAASPTDTLRATFSAYNAARPSGLAATGTACKTASQSLQTGPRPSGGALAQVYRDAMAGFRDCVRAAHGLDYPAASRALTQIAAANAALRRAARG